MSLRARSSWTLLLLAAFAANAAPATRAEDPVPAVQGAPNLCGSWSGCWMSQERNHKGPLSAEFCQLDACRYEVRFKGKFCKFIPFHYTAVLTVTGVADGKVYLSGSQRLGPLMGTFSYNAWATQTQFVANYCAKDDHGQFVMSRCCQ